MVVAKICKQTFCSDLVLKMVHSKQSWSSNKNSTILVNSSKVPTPFIRETSNDNFYLTKVMTIIGDIQVGNKHKINGYKLFK